MPEAAFFNPSLTTVTNDFETAGRTCLEFLLRRIRDPQSPAERLIIRPELVRRESTGKNFTTRTQRVEQRSVEELCQLSRHHVCLQLPGLPLVFAVISLPGSGLLRTSGCAS